MKKAVIQTGGKQYLVQEGQVIDVERLSDEKLTKLAPLLIIDDKEVFVGKPILETASVTAEVLGVVRDDKVTAIRYKAKKRVHKVRGHRQQKTQLKITKITQK